MMGGGNPLDRKKRAAHLLGHLLCPSMSLCLLTSWDTETEASFVQFPLLLNSNGDLLQNSDIGTTGGTEGGNAGQISSNSLLGLFPPKFRLPKVSTILLDPNCSYERHGSKMEQVYVGGLTHRNGKTNQMKTNSRRSPKSICVVTPISLREDKSYLTT